jgi:trehalose/maltose transport system substrate-binding protein
LVTGRTIDVADEPVQDNQPPGSSRRELLKRAAALGLATPILGSLASLRGAAAQDATPPATPLATPSPGTGSTIVVPSNLRTDLVGAEISVQLSPSGPALAWEQVACDIFSQATGIIVNRVPGQIRSAERLQQALILLQLHSRDIDVFMLDMTWVGRFPDLCFNLKKTYQSQGYEYFEQLVTNNTAGGKLVAMPWTADAGLLYSRTDLLQKYGYSQPPATWAELETMAKAMQDGERASNPDFWGFVFQGANYEGLTCDAFEWQLANGGGTIVNGAGKVTINNTRAITAFERARDWVGTISPSNVTEFDEEEGRFIWQASNAAFMRNWQYAYALGHASDSVIKDKFDVSVLPAGDGDRATTAATFGGWQIMVSRYAKYRDAAAEFAKYITSKELQKSLAIEQAKLPTIPELYDDPDVLAANPLVGKLKDILLTAAVVRPSTKTAPSYDKVSSAYSTTVNQILAGSVDAKSAVADLSAQLKHILSFLG